MDVRACAMTGHRNITHALERGLEKRLLDVIEELGGEQEGLYTCQLNKNQDGGNGHPVEDAHDVAARILKNFITDKGLL